MRPESDDVQRSTKADLECFPTLEEALRRHIIEALETTDYNVGKAAKILGIGRSTLYNYIKRFNISKADRP